MKLMEFDFNILNRPWADNSKADRLSRQAWPNEVGAGVFPRAPVAGAVNLKENELKTLCNGERR